MTAKPDIVPYIGKDAFSGIDGFDFARPSDGICHDGLTVAGLNRNHGAESILSYHLAAAAIREFLLRQPANAA